MNQSKAIRLGVNIDHVATLRQARGTPYPSVLEAAELAERGGADSITVHLREDRRHIQDNDVRELKDGIGTALNLEMAVTKEMLDFAEAVQPRDCCLVPEKREELTTEGGLGVAADVSGIRDACDRLQGAGIHVALFIDPDPEQLEAVQQTGAPAIEIHTGAYADAESDEERKREWERIHSFAAAAATAGIEVHAGHGLTLDNVPPIAGIAEIEELNIGHSIIARAVMVGLTSAVAEMRACIDAARSSLDRALE